MCRNIKTLHNVEPPASSGDIRAASMQFVRKISGSTRPTKANETAFKHAVDLISLASHELLTSLLKAAPPKNSECESNKARASEVLP